MNSKPKSCLWGKGINFKVQIEKTVMKNALTKTPNFTRIVTNINTSDGPISGFTIIGINISQIMPKIIIFTETCTISIGIENVIMKITENPQILCLHSSEEEIFIEGCILKDKEIANLKRYTVQTNFNHKYELMKMISDSIALVKLKESSDLAVAKILNLKKKKFERILVEVEALRKVHSPHTPSLIGVFEDGDELRIIVEYYSEKTLTDYIEDIGNLGEEESLIILKQILEGVLHLNQKDLSHRDIKTDNIIVKEVLNESYKRVQIIDLEYCEDLSKEVLQYKFCGTPGFCAPEILEFKKYDEKCDIFSCGVVLYIMLAGDSLFDFVNGDVKSTIRENMKCNIADKLNDLEEVFDESILYLLRGMLSKDVAARPSILQCLETLKKCLDKLKINVPTSPTAAIPRGTRRMSSLVRFIPMVKNLSNEKEIEKKQKKCLSLFPLSPKSRELKRVERHTKTVPVPQKKIENLFQINIQRIKLQRVNDNLKNSRILILLIIIKYMGFKNKEINSNYYFSIFLGISWFAQL